MSSKTDIKNQLTELSDMQDAIQNLYDTWYSRLNLWNWDITVTFELGACDDGETYAHAACSWQYLNGTIVFFLKTNLGRLLEEVEETVVHELCHFMVCELRGTDEHHVSPDHIAHEERVVTTLARAYLAVAREEK